MNKRELNIACIMFIIVFTICVSSRKVIAASITNDGFAYSINNNIVTITGYAGSGGSIKIPDKIENLQVTSIGDYAFRLCESITDVTIPDSVTSIGFHAFFGCSNLDNITIPDSITDIGFQAFYSTPWFNKISPDSSGFIILGNNVLAAYKGSMDVVTIPDNVTSIAGGAFQDCPSLINVTIPNSVKSIGDYAFCSCKKLKNIIIPDSVTNIGDSAFGFCISLNSITIPNSVTMIGKDVFISCSKLTNITIPGSVKIIGNGAFYNCENLSNLMIPNSVMSIGDSAFFNCGRLDSIVIPNSVTNIGNDVFRQCRNLKNITISNSAATIGSCVFYDSGITTGSSITMYKNFSCGSSQNVRNVLINGNDATIKLEYPIKNQTVEAIADTLIPTAGVNNEITLQVKDSAGNLQNSSTQIAFNSGEAFNTTTTVAISGIIPAQDGSYGSITYDDGSGEKILKLNSDSASTGGQKFQLKFLDGQAKCKLVLNNTTKQIIEFTVDGIASPKTPILSMTPVSPQTSSIIPISASFDRYNDSTNYKDVPVAVMLNGNTLKSITNGNTSLDLNSNYVLNEDTTVTIKKEYLSSQAVGNIILLFNFSGGNSQTLNIEIKDSTPIHQSSGCSGGDNSIPEFKSFTGSILDEVTGKAIGGAKIALYYANTERNKSSGKTPDAEVSLPKIDRLKPNNNVNPQSSDSYGAYGFMVFPDTDYYMVVEKDGYSKYTSPIISVGKDIVKWNIDLHAFGTERLYGQDRIDTNLQITKAAFPNGFSNVVLASSENYPDALSGSVLSYKLNAPILLIGNSDTDKAKVFSYLENNISTIGTVYILGGTGSIGSNVEDKLSSDGFKNIVRIGGQDRFETAVKIDDKIEAKEGTPIVIVSGENYPDALSISSIAAQNGYPIFMTPKDKIPDEVKEKISTLKPSKVYVIGLEGVISKDVENQISNMTSLDSKNIIRIGGKDRFETSLDIAKYFGLSASIECAASGSNFPDALSGSIYAAKNKAHVILVGDKLNDGEKEYFKNPKLSVVVIFGGTGSVSNEVQGEISNVISK